MRLLFAAPLVLSAVLMGTVLAAEAPTLTGTGTISSATAGQGTAHKHKKATQHPAAPRSSRNPFHRGRKTSHGTPTPPASSHTAGQ